jgi:hypothetical protein
MADTFPKKVIPTLNGQLLKQVNRTALIGEITEKTKDCSILWDKIAPYQYRSTLLPWDFYITRSHHNYTSLDVWRNAQFYRNYNSYTQPEVQDLWDVVDTMGDKSQQFDRAKDMMSFMSKIGRCDRISLDFFNELASGGLKGAGVGSVSTVQINNQFTLLPFSMTTSPPVGSVTFTGTVLDIDDAPNVLSHDSDATYAMMNYNGLSNNTNYPPPFKIFINPLLIPFGVYSVVRTRLVARLKSLTDSLTVKTDYAINDTVNASGLGVITKTNLPSSYFMIDSGFVPLPIALTNAEITSLGIFVYVTTQTYTADPSQTELRITAADITVGTLTEF